MRRVFAILLLVLFNVMLIAPVVSANSGPDLPSCCRRAGKHGCGMSHASKSSGVALQRSNKCPMFPVSGMASAHAYAGLAASVQLTRQQHASHPAGRTQTEARYRISFSRSRQKRGPPSLLA